MENNLRVVSGREFIMLHRGASGEWELVAGSHDHPEAQHRVTLATALEHNPHLVTLTSTGDAKRLGEAWISARVRDLRGCTVEYVSLAGVLTSIRGEVNAHFLGL